MEHAPKHRRPARPATNPDLASQLTPSPEPIGGAASEITVRALVVSGRREVRSLVDGCLFHQVESLIVAKTCREARAAAAAAKIDLVIVGEGMADGDAIELVEELAVEHAGLTSVVVALRPALDDAVRAMRAGACDMIDASDDERRVAERLVAAARKAEETRKREDRALRLQNLCGKLNDARREVSDHVGGLCTDLVDAYRDLSDQMNDVAATSELNSLLRQELEIESLLRTLLEYLLAKIGSTNAAVFLPSSGGDFSVGAYVNYDIPRDRTEVLLDHLANAVAPEFEGQGELLELDDEASLEAALGDDAHWLDDQSVQIVACRQEDECLAVLMIFRDRNKPFSDEAKRLLGLAAGLFGAQLGRVIKVHHRHLPRDEWGTMDEPGDSFGDDFGDDYGLAA